MVWQKTDDQFGVSKKVVRIPRARRFQVIGLWTLAGNYACRVLSDGLLESHELDELGAKKNDIAELVRVDLWHEHGHACTKCVDPEPDGIVIHDFLIYNPSRAEVEAAKEAERVRKANYRAKKKGSPEGSPTGTDDGTPAGRDPESGLPVPDPSPTRPPSSTKKVRGAANRGTRIPADFVVTSEMVAWAKEHAPLVNGKIATEKFINYWTAKSGTSATKLDWVLTWRNWMLTDQERQGEHRPPEPAQSPRRVVSGRAAR